MQDADRGTRFKIKDPDTIIDMLNSIGTMRATELITAKQRVMQEALQMGSYTKGHPHDDEGEYPKKVTRGPKRRE